MIEFVSYNGRYPNLCGGNLVLKINGETRELLYALCSGGSCGFDDEWNEIVESGEWTINDLPEDLEQYRHEITALVNENISQGCCGGCL